MDELGRLETYRRLADYIDGLAGNFPPAVGGEEIPLLETLYTPEEAALAVHLTLDRDLPSLIAARAGAPVAVVHRRLELMAHKGLVFAVEGEDGARRYQAAPFVVGIYEFQIDAMRPEFLEAVGTYWRAQKQHPPTEALPQLRTVPVGESIAFHPETLAYQQVDALIEGHRRYGVAPCICRTHAQSEGGGCDAPIETCLGFDEFADYYISEGKGREITLDEVREIIRQADAANLVLQPSNSKEAAFICCCCGCCCGVLGGLKAHPKPAEVATSAYIAAFDAELCEGCWTCLDRCQMDAFTEDGTRVAYNADRCIGCGLCVSTCPTGALALVAKPFAATQSMPDTFLGVWRANRDAWARQTEG